VSENEGEKSHLCIAWKGNLNVMSGVAILFPAAFHPAIPGNSFAVLRERKSQCQQEQILRR